jgi:hypothetical protein
MTSTLEKEITVFDILRESQCAGCGEDLARGSFLTMEDGKPFCLDCADLGHLVYLPRGDAALTRRSKKNSALSAVVIRFSRTRKRYERQGILVEEAALENAEAECLSDESQRDARRERDAARRTHEDLELTRRMAARIRALFPGCSAAEANRIAQHTAERGSGRVGRSAAGRALEDEAIELAVAAAVRHRHTNYDELLMSGIDRLDARRSVRESTEALLERWRATSNGARSG